VGSGLVSGPERGWCERSRRVGDAGVKAYEYASAYRVAATFVMGGPVTGRGRAVSLIARAVWLS